MELTESRKASLLLLFLSPIIAELVSGSTPLLQFINPIILLSFLGYYGSAVLIIRELYVRWKKGYVSLFILGMAYGIIEEGLTVKSFFSTTWPDLGILGVYGRWLGVNWVWAVNLTLIHAVLSISLPVFIVDLLYPELKGKSLISSRIMVLLGIIFIVDAFFLSAILISGYCDPILYLGAIIIVIILGIIAKNLPPQLEFNGSRPLPPSFIFWLVGTMWSFGNWFIFFNLPRLNLPPIITIFLGILVCLGIYLFLKMFDWSNGSLQKIWLAFGVLTFYFFIDFLLEFSGGTATEPGRGMSLVAIGFIIFLMYVRSKIKSNQ